MYIFMHVAGVVLLFCLFLLGKMMAEGRETWAEALAGIPVRNAYLCNFFLYGGRIFEGVAMVWGLLEVVAVMILTSGWIIDMLVAATQ